MATEQTRISANISPETKALLEYFARMSGERILERLNQPGQPTEAIQDLFKDD